MATQNVTEEEVVKIAHLSKLSLEGNELKNLTKDFNQILEFVGQIESAHIDNDLSFSHPLDLSNATRHDQEKPSVSLDEVRQLSEHFESGFFVVPKIIDSE